MKNVVFIGAGNVSTSLAFAFNIVGWTIKQVYSRSLQNAEIIARNYNAMAINRLSDIDTTANLYIISVFDSSIVSISEELKEVEGVVVHTSGSTSLSVLAKTKSRGIGVLYPFQTFSRNRLVDLSNVPIFVEANAAQTLVYLTEVAKELSSNVMELDSNKRMWLHISGVFASNFTNHILALTYRLASENGLDFKLIQPLVEETVQKAFGANPKDVQTGPAIRNDKLIMENHSAMLGKFDEQLQKIYNELSLSIQKLSKQ
ncbi:MAG: Rossmann-like and DUF2520 domain-containing protein [Bacteroidales bacterium]